MQLLVASPQQTKTQRAYVWNVKIVKEALTRYRYTKRQISTYGIGLEANHQIAAMTEDRLMFFGITTLYVIASKTI